MRSGKTKGEDYPKKGRFKHYLIGGSKAYDITNEN